MALLDEGAGLVPDTSKKSERGLVVQLQDPAPASYRGFPDRTEVGRARAGNVRRCRLRPLAKLLTAAVS
jgi:hypothetical protein